MTKISITEKFASDAINAPALVTGGKSCKKKSVKKSKVKCKSKSKKSGSKGTRGNSSPPPYGCPKA